MKWSAVILARLVLGAVFVFAGAVKVFNPQLFAAEIDHYSLLPVALINFTAITLPWVELLGGLLLLTGFWVRASATLLAGLTGVFLVAVLTVLVRGLKIKCGCFGTVGTEFVGWGNIALDTVLLALAAWLARHGKE
jgi:hypothetical protein